MTGRITLLAILFFSQASADPLASGDRIDGRWLMRYSGETVVWVACANDFSEPGAYAEWEMRDLVNDVLVSAGTSPLANNQYRFPVTIPRVGVFGAQVRACTANGNCTEWVKSGTMTAVNCLEGADYLLSTLAPPGAPEI